jgi:hypothetical protein
MLTRRTNPWWRPHSCVCRTKCRGMLKWRTHSCVPRRHSCRRPGLRANAGVEESNAGVEKSLDTARMSACATRGEITW